MSPSEPAAGEPLADAGPGAVRICYVILSHQVTGHVQRLVAAIRRGDPDGSIVVRHDHFAAGRDPGAQLPQVDGAHVIGVTRPAAWGSYELTESILDAWRWAREHLAFDWVVLLTGQDYPARPLAELGAHLGSSGVDAFMELDEVAGGRGLTRARDVGAELYRYRYYGGPSTARLPFSRMGFLLSVARWQPFVSVRVNPRVHRMLFGYRSPRAPFSATFPPVWARNWVALSRPGLDLLLDHVERHPRYIEHYRRTFHSAESFFQTIMWNHPGIRVRPRGLHFERWDPRHPSPEILTIDDLTAIVRSDAFFVRKLAAGRGDGVIDALDELAAGREPGEVVSDALARRLSRRRRAVERAAAVQGGRSGSPESDGRRAGRPPTLVSVIMPVRNAEATLAEQLDALLSQTYAGDWELLVADNGSSDRTREIAASYAGRIPGLRVVDAAERPGAAHARNVAAREARGDVLAFCDGDDVVDAGWLEALADAMTEHVFVGGRLDYTTLNPNQWPIVVEEDALEVHLGYMPAASSSNLAIDAAVFEELGGFDDSYGSYGEDIDLSWRAQLAGYPLVYAKDAVVAWRSKDSFEGWLRQVYRVGRVGARLYRQYRSRGLRREPVLPILRGVASITVHAPASLLRTRDERRWSAQWLAYRAGRLRGSLQQRVLFL